MKRYRWHILLGLSLLAVSALCYALQIAFFHRERDTIFYMIQDFAFVPIQVLLVTLVINGMLQMRERSSLQHKMNMVIGAFFNEMGSGMLRYFSDFDANRDQMAQVARVREDWSDRDFTTARKRLRHHRYAIDCRREDLGALKEFLIGKRHLLLDLLSNPNLLEHESFTELLWATTHLTEELGYRSELTGLPQSDVDHIATDLQRAYVLLASEWLRYVRHLKEHYPYMFMLVLRTNPFDPNASPIVEG